jgi:hypothetical protein
MGRRGTSYCPTENTYVSLISGVDPAAVHTTWQARKGQNMPHASPGGAKWQRFVVVFFGRRPIPSTSHAGPTVVVVATNNWFVRSIWEERNREKVLLAFLGWIKNCCEFADAWDADLLVAYVNVSICLIRNPEALAAAPSVSFCWSAKNSDSPHRHAFRTTINKEGRSSRRVGVGQRRTTGSLMLTGG